MTRGCTVCGPVARLVHGELQCALRHQRREQLIHGLHATLDLWSTRYGTPDTGSALCRGKVHGVGTVVHGVGTVVHGVWRRTRPSLSASPSPPPPPPPPRARSPRRPPARARPPGCAPPSVKSFRRSQKSQKRRSEEFHTRSARCTAGGVLGACTVYNTPAARGARSRRRTSAAAPPTGAARRCEPPPVTHPYGSRRWESQG